MKKITLLHTVRSVYESFSGDLRAAIPEWELDICNTLDEFLSVDANRRGAFTLENKNRLRLLLQAKDLEGADLIVTTCSTLTPAVEQIRPFLKTPVVAIDDEMAQQAISAGSRIAVVATAQSAMEPTRQKLQAEAAKAGSRAELSDLLCTEAFRAIQRMEKKEHDRLLLEAVSGLRGVDVIVLAQASMAHLEEKIEALTGCKTLSSPCLCFERIKRLLGK